MKITTNIIINAPLEKVFKIFTDLEQLSKRVAGITRVEMLKGNAKIEVGTKWRETRTVFGKETTEDMWVTEVMQNKSYVVEAKSHGTKYHSEYTFREVEDGIQVTMVFEGTPISRLAKIMSVMFIFFKKATEKMLHQDMVDLKVVCEKVYTS